MTQHARTMLGTFGVSFTDFTPLYLDFAGGAEAVERGDADAQLQCPIPNKVMTALAGRCDVRVLPYGAGELDALLRAVPFYRRTVMRKGAIRGLDADVEQAAVVNVLVTHARVADAKVQAVSVRHPRRARRAAKAQRAVQRARRIVHPAAIGRRARARIRRRRAASGRRRCLSRGRDCSRRTDFRCMLTSAAAAGLRDRCPRSSLPVNPLASTALR